MTVFVAGQPGPPWCSASSLAALNEAWRADSVGSVICQSPGVYFADGAARIVLPRCYAGIALGDNGHRAALVLLRALEQYRRHPRRGAVEEESGEVTIRNIDSVHDTMAWLEAALLLSEDFTRNGPLYLASTAISPRRQGRVHWVKTQRNAVHVVDGANVMASPLWRARRTIDPEDLLTRLHVDTCAETRSELGRGANTGRVWSPSDALSILDRRDRGLFADRHRTVALWLRQYWTSIARSGGTRRAGVSALWSPSFPLVWEEMLRTVMAGRSLRMPQGTYRIGASSQVGLHLIPDFVVDSRSALLVVDAKHYDLATLPQSESLTKQMLYRWFASAESGHGSMPMAVIHSVFVLPAVGRPQSLEVIGVHELAQERGPGAFGRVWVAAADFETVATAFASRELTPSLAATLFAATAATS